MSSSANAADPLSGAPAAQQSGADMETGGAPPGADTAQPAPEATPPRQRHRIRNGAVGVLVVLTCLMVLITTVGLWSYRQVYNTDVFVSHVDSVVRQPDVQASLANYLTDQVMTAVNPEQRAKAALPAQADPLIGPVVSAMRSFVNQAALKVVSNDQFHTLIHNAARRAHDAAIKLLEGKKVAGLTINGNQVVFNTLPMIDQVLQQVSQQGLLSNVKIPPLSTPDDQPSAQAKELASKVGVTLPPDFGQLVVFKSDSLKSAQQALRLIKRLLVLLVVLTVVLIAATLVLSLHRLRTLAELGVGVAVAMLVAWAVTKRITSDVIAQVKTDSSRKAAHAVVNNFLGTFRDIVIVLAVVGVVAALVAFLAGRSRTAVWVRGRFTAVTAPAGGGEPGGVVTRAAGVIAAHRDGLLIIGAGVGVVILLAGGFTWPAVIVAVVVAAVWEGVVWFAASRHPRGTGTDGGPSSTMPTMSLEKERM